MARLCLVITSLRPGGAERVMADLANHWTGQGHQVTLLLFSCTPDEEPFYPIHSDIQCVGLRDKNEKPSSFWKNPFGYGRSFVLRLMRMRKWMKEQGSHGVLSFMDKMNMMTLALSWGLNMPVVVSERIDPHEQKLSFFWDRMRLFLYRRAKYVVMQTKDAARYYEGKGVPITVIPNAVTPPLAVKKSLVHPVRKLMTVGRLDKQKNHGQLIDVVARLSKKYPDITLTICGEGPERPFLEKKIRDLDLVGKVFLPGVVSHPQEVMGEYDLFVLPSLYEGFPNALCEAMAMGMPVIASDISGSRTIVRHGYDGLLVPKGEEDPLIMAIDSLMSDLTKAQKLGQNAHNIIHRFPKNKLFQRWSSLFCLKC